MNAPDWLTARPIAHRGLHDAARGVWENSPDAARAAIAHGFAIECDVQVSADGEAMVFHDFTLDRSTAETGRVDARSARELASIPLAIGGEQIIRFVDFVSMVAGRAPVVCEIKSRFDGDLRLALRVADIVAQCSGPIALKSFDPSIMAELRSAALALNIAYAPLGVVAMTNYQDPEARIDEATRRALAALLHWDRTRPDFLSFCVDDLPHAGPHLARSRLGAPVLAWTVRTGEQATRARAFADQMIFEGALPITLPA
jgi:glycerophosphoryl diester phosphodiesterase